MEYTSIFLCYGGEWIEDNKYTGSNMMGILVPRNCTYKQLIDMLFLELQLDPELVAVTIHYKVGENLPPVRISSNNNLQCYLNLKMVENDLSRFPLCIDVTMVKHGHNRENVRDIQSTSTDVIMLSFNYLELTKRIRYRICVPKCLKEHVYSLKCLGFNSHISKRKSQVYSLKCLPFNSAIIRPGHNNL
ncbi:Uncharacterized protein Fot_41104 [Forsythia ovata]|uniref:Uncharacterized protein n=1 Tax=Forsythia ovata TaxID=205694 RepID=A0ABD1RHB2_9LAMI